MIERSTLVEATVSSILTYFLDILLFESVL